MFQTELRNELSLVAKLHFSVLRVCLKSFEFVYRRHEGDGWFRRNLANGSSPPRVTVSTAW